MAVVELSVIETQVRQYLPSGPFWDQPGLQRDAADRLVRIIGGALFGDGVVLGSSPTNPGLVEFLSCLNIYMRPESTPYRSVLLQYYEYLAIPTCTPIPDDLEELRAIVVGANTADPSHTPAGLRAWINATLHLVEVSESLPLPVPPSLPGAGWWAVVEIWHVPIIDPAETVLCVSRPVVRGSNDIRLVAPSVLWHAIPESALITRADKVTLIWSEMRADTKLTVQRFTLGMVLIESVITAVVSPSDFRTGDNLFPLLNPADNVHDQIWTVTAERVFPDALGTFDLLGTVSITL